MAREAFYIKPKSTEKLIDILPAVNQKAKIARMSSLSNNLDSVRQYGFTATFYYPTPTFGVALEGENLDEKNVSRFSLAVKSIDLPDFSARVSHSTLMGISGQSINYHIDKKFKIKVEELTQDLLLHKLRTVGLLHQLGDSESQESIYSEIVKLPVFLPTSYAVAPPNFVGYTRVATKTGTVNKPIYNPPFQIPAIGSDVRKTPHYSFDLRLSKYFANGDLHSILDFLDCKIVGFKQSSFDYTKSNAMSELDFEIVFDELISVPPTEYADKIPKEIAKLLND